MRQLSFHCEQMENYHLDLYLVFIGLKILLERKSLDGWSLP